MSYICLSMYSPGFARYAIVSSANNNGFGSSFSHNPTSYFYFLLYPASYKRGPWGAQWNGNSQTEFSSSFGKDGCEIKKKKKSGRKQRGVAGKPLCDVAITLALGKSLENRKEGPQARETVQSRRMDVAMVVSHRDKPGTRLPSQIH